MTSIDEQIATLIEERQQLWREGVGGDEIDRINTQLTELWDMKRRAKAELVSGNPVEIIRRARLESELERLMSQD